MDLETALGDGWLKDVIGGFITFGVGGVVAWIAKRPIQQAGVLAAVNARLEAFMKTQQAALDAEREAHAKCEARIENLEGHRERDRAEIDQLRGELRAASQLAQSARRRPPV